MSFWKKVKQSAIVDRLVEEKLYEQVLREFESGVRRDGLWAKAFQKSQGDEQRTNALYFEYRVQSIKDEAEILAVLAEKAVPSRQDVPVAQVVYDSTKAYAKPKHTNIENKKQAPVESDYLEPRTSCIHGECIGIIRKNGKCGVCGQFFIPEKNSGNFVQHKRPEAQCQTCGFIAFGADPDVAACSRCLGCGNIMGDIS